MKVGCIQSMFVGKVHHSYLNCAQFQSNYTVSKVSPIIFGYLKAFQSTSEILNYRAEHVFNISPTVGAFVPEQLPLIVMGKISKRYLCSIFVTLVKEKFICFPVFKRVFCLTRSEANSQTCRPE